MKNEAEHIDKPQGNGVLPCVSGSIMPKVKYRDLKAEFVAIQNDAIGKPLTMVLMQELDYKYRDLFEYFGLRDLQYRLTKGNESIQFTPIRPIDELAIAGILGL